jgi:hypothetical protein
MLEIKNKQKFPVQILVRSRTAPRAFTCLNIPGVGGGKNVYYLEDEKNTDYVERAEKDGLISVRHIPNKTKKGE